MEGMKKFVLWKYAAFALAFCLLFSVVMYPMIGRASSTNSMVGAGQAANQQRTINVSGTADVMVAPDEVDISVGIETRSVDFKKARSENDENSKKVIELTKKFGIDSKNVQSDYIRTYPIYNYEQHTETSKVSCYNVQKRIVIKLKDISKFEALTSELMNNGVVMIQNIEFRSTELAKYKNEARKLAVRAAKDKAKLLASELGSDIGKPVTINEEQIDNYTWYGSWYGYGQSNSAFSNVAVNYQNSQGSTEAGQNGETISVGQIKITAKIGVVFELS